MIPKIIHYCWFGRGEKPKLFYKCYNSWKKLCPDFKIIEWNEDNFDINSAPIFVKEAYENRRYAFVSDYARLKIVYENGGIYLDTDVELIKPLESFLNYNAFFGMQYEGPVVNTGCGFGGIKGEKILLDLMTGYQGIHFVKNNGEFDISPCPWRDYSVFKKYGFLTENKDQILNDGILILPSEIMCPKAYKGEIKITKKQFQFITMMLLGELIMNVKILKIEKNLLGVMVKKGLNLVK